MGEYSDVTLDRDRAFDIEAINELLTQGKSVLKEAINISEKMENSISVISGIYNEIDVEYRVGALGTDIASLSGALKKDIYQDTIDRMDQILTKLMNDMPSYDNSLAQSVDGIQEVLSTVKGRVSELRGLLDTGDVNLSYTEYSQRLKDIKAGWDESTEDLAELLAEIENDMLGVTAAAVQYSYDPVNLSTGNFVYDHEDIRIGGEIPLSFHRYYNAKDRIKGSMGRCFLHNYEIHLEENEEKGKVTIRMEDGQKKTFRRNEDGTYQSLYSSLEILKKDKDAYVLLTISGERYIFDKDGHIIRQENRQGKGISFTYDASGRLGQAATDHDAFLTYHYDEAGQLIQVADHTGRTVKLSYEKGKLARVENPQGSTYVYHYGKNGRIEESINPRGYVSVKNTYDEKRRIINQAFPDGGHMAYAYDDSKRQVVLTERNGSKIIYVHDSKYRNTDILYEDGTKEHFEYNGKNQRILHTDRNGNTTKMAYDNRGNLTRITNALGETTTLTYNAGNQLIVLKVNGKEKLRSHYDSKGNLISSIGADGNGNRITYDEQNRPVFIENADKSVTKITYDARGNIETIHDGNGGDICYQYDSLNRVISVTDGNGNITSFEYNKMDKILRTINPLGDSRCYEYNESGKVTKVIDYDGYVVEAAYNEIGKIHSVTDKEGNITEYSYDEMWHVNQIVHADGGRIRYVYDRNGRLCETHLPNGGKLQYTYDGNGNCIEITQPDGSKKQYNYDALNRVVMEIDEIGAETAYSYDENGNLICVKDALGNETRYTYDSMGNCITKTDKLGHTTSYQYDCMGNVVSIQYPNKTIETRKYKAGKLSEVMHPDGSGMYFDYDGNGNCICMKNTAGEKISITYDALNRKKTVTNPDGGILEYEYDVTGNVTKIIDELGHCTYYEYSPNGNLTCVTDALGNKTQYAYDAMGHLTKVERIGELLDDGHMDVQTTIYDWNSSGLVSRITDPLGMVESFDYDVNDRMTDKWDRDGYHTSYSYDFRGLLQNIFYDDGTSVTYSYDALRRLEEIKDIEAVTKIQSDTLGRVLSVTDSFERTVGYEWGSVNEKLSLQYPDGKNAVYSYNEKGQLIGLRSEKGTVVYQYDKTGRLTEKHFSNGVRTKYNYNQTGRIESIQHIGSNINESYVYRYDTAGNKIEAIKNRAEVPEDNGRFEYRYDELNRLTEVHRDNTLLSRYSYDGFGNRTLLEDYNGMHPVRTSYMYNANNQLMTRSEDGEQQSYQYDHRGNLISVYSGENILKSFTFDATNQMIRSSQVENGMVKYAEYTYNALGMRTGQNIYKAIDSSIENNKDNKPADPENQIRYTLDLTRQYYNLLAYEDLADKTEQRFYWDNNVVFMEESEEDFYYLQDDLGSPMQLMDEEGELRETYGFDAFGLKLENHSKSQIQPFGYTGYQKDEVGGLYFAQARRYDAGIGRFVSEDKVKGYIENPMSLNKYNYCFYNPLNFIDLNGREAEYCAAYYMLDKEGAAGQGHTAILLEKDDGTGYYYSFAAENAEHKVVPCILGLNVKGEMSYKELDEQGVSSVLNGEDIKTSSDQPDSPGSSYEGIIKIDITNEEGIRMKERATNIMGSNGTDGQYYNLYSNNCSMKVQDILAAGNPDYAWGPVGLNQQGKKTKHALDEQIMLGLAIPNLWTSGWILSLGKYGIDCYDGTVPKSVFKKGKEVAKDNNWEVYEITGEGGEQCHE